ncbi:MAG: hypothetical protein MAG795_00830 [Candidatus Woesearchaeota archaeon]|nr:hypothetical protein [Candidatus Woesearchaeota archaeon]
MAYRGKYDYLKDKKKLEKVIKKHKNISYTK